MILSGQVPYPIAAWVKWVNALATAPEEPQELGLLKSSQATHCLKFFLSLNGVAIAWSEHQKLSHIKDMTPLEKIYSTKNWCQHEHLIPAESPMYPKHYLWVCS